MESYRRRTGKMESYRRGTGKTESYRRRRWSHIGGDRKVFKL